MDVPDEIAFRRRYISQYIHIPLWFQQVIVHQRIFHVGSVNERLYEGALNDFGARNSSPGKPCNR